MDFQIARFFFQISRPFSLLSGVLVYALGVGVANYLGIFINWPLVFLGQAWLTIIQLGTHYLVAYFWQAGKRRDPGRIPIPAAAETHPEGLRRDLLLWAAFAAFAAAASLTFILARTGNLSLATFFVMAGIFILMIGYAVPPFSFIYSGYGELILSIVMANLVPALGFMLQADELHRLVNMTTFPLTMLHLSMLLALQFPAFLPNLKRERSTLLTRLGWEKGLLLHNILILLAFVQLGAAMLFGLPTQVALPVFFVFPLGLFQIWYLSQIGAGAKPNWRALTLTATMTFGLTAYLLTFTLWTR